MVVESEHLPTSHNSAKLEGYTPATLLVSATDKTRAVEAQLKLAHTPYVLVHHTHQQWFGFTSSCYYEAVYYSNINFLI
jgi:hypothetical protein